jgi:hypothetical protein
VRKDIGVLVHMINFDAARKNVSAQVCTLNFCAARKNVSVQVCALNFSIVRKNVGVQDRTINLLVCSVHTHNNDTRSVRNIGRVHRSFVGARTMWVCVIAQQFS